MDEKDQAYWERNQLVSYISKIYYSWLERHPEKDTEWEDEWRNIIFIQFPKGKYSWHIHDREMKYFKHLQFYDTDSWDGSTTEQKYQALRGEKNGD
jgi:hypothetical protein